MEHELERLLRSLTGSLFDQSGLQMNAEARLPSTVFGYTLRIGTDGRPVLQEHDNACEDCSVDGVRDPLVDTITNNKDGTTKLVAEMPGVEREDINVSVNDKHVNIDAENGEKKYRARVPLRHRVKEDSISATYKNGILEVSFQLLGEPKPEGKKVEVQ